MDDLSASLKARFPWMSLGTFPTRVERVTGLATDDVELWVKHENESSSLFGGNKVRKLEFLLGAARACGCRRVLTFGGTGAHHVAATALHGAAHGFEVEAALFPQPLDDHVRALARAELQAGARLHHVPNVLAALAYRARSGRDTAWLAGGGSSPLGTLGWVAGGGEILAQIDQGELPPIDAVYCALGSCGTVAGLWWSLRRARPLELVAVRVVPRPIGRWMTRRLVRGVSALLAGTDVAPAGTPPTLRVEHRFVGRGYGFPSPESLDAVARAADRGLELEPIYTGKVMAALLEDARDGRLRGKRVLFLQTQSTAPLTGTA